MLTSVVVEILPRLQHGFVIEVGSGLRTTSCYVLGRISRTEASWQCMVVIQTMDDGTCGWYR